jgi:hypothetical protein
MQHPAQQIGQQEGAGAVDAGPMPGLLGFLATQALQQGPQALLKQLEDPGSADGFTKLIPHRC